MKSNIVKSTKLNVYFRETRVVKDFCLEVRKGEIIGIIGESGSGKTSAVHAISGLLRGAHIEGSVLFDGIELLGTSENVLGTGIGVVFQDPMTSLNPTMQIQKQIAEGMIYHELYPPKQALEKAIEWMGFVGLPKEKAKCYPHQLSGGQRQRVAIAIAIACNPKLLIADEPTTALDAITQVEILELLKELQKKLDMAVILVSHDLSVIRWMCDRIILFKEGKSTCLS
jgi:ABC-type glutathione transport system ATPase component